MVEDNVPLDRYCDQHLLSRLHELTNDEERAFVLVHRPESFNTSERILCEAPSCPNLASWAVLLK
jgi:hypothetical protein